MHTGYIETQRISMYRWPVKLKTCIYKLGIQLPTYMHISITGKCTRFVHVYKPLVYSRLYAALEHVGVPFREYSNKNTMN